MDIATMNYDKGNLADDERNSKMSDLAQNNDRFTFTLNTILSLATFQGDINNDKLENKYLKQKLKTIKSIAKKTLAALG